MADIPESVEAETALGKFKFSGANLNNLFTVLSFACVVTIGFTLYAHAGDTRDAGRTVAAELKASNKEVSDALRESNKEMRVVIKELSRATREQNCLLSLPQEQRQRNSETCKRISQ